MLTSPADPLLLLSLLLGFLSAALFIGVLLYPRLSAQRQYRARLLEVTGRGEREKADRRKSSGLSVDLRLKGGRSLEETLRDLEAQRLARIKRQKTPPLLLRMRQAGLYLSKFSYILIVFITGLVIFLLAVLSNIVPYAALGFGIAAGLLLPHLTVNFLRNRRLKAFSTEFPKALDITIRGLKAGLPFGDCLGIVARDLQAPLSTEFQAVVDDQALGVPIAEAMNRMAERIPLQDVNFLAVVVNIQAKSGGSLAESLQNLANTLRERRKLAGKVRAMSQEAKSSAAIIGSMPFFVAGVLYVINPDYIMVLFTEPAGKLVLAVSAFWMGLGIAVMRKMINFEI
jgi:tight adherence protein B